MINISWDLQIDLRTGDLVWNSIRDLSAVEAENLIRQRIHVRLKVERGAFIYDEAGTLGSRLNSLLDAGVPRAAANIEMIVREALEPMTDIVVTDVVVNYYGDGTDAVVHPQHIKALIKYHLVFAGNEALSPDIPTQLETQVAIPA